MSEDHYKTLQVRREADPDVIEKAYKALCLKHHPDRVPEHERPRATERMKAINEAYRVLSSSRLRARYDSSLGADPSTSAWDQFMNKGLVGMFLDRVTSRG